MLTFASPFSRPKIHRILNSYFCTLCITVFSPARRYDCRKDGNNKRLQLSKAKVEINPNPTKEFDVNPNPTLEFDANPDPTSEFDPNPNPTSEFHTNPNRA